MIGAIAPHLGAGAADVVALTREYARIGTELVVRVLREGLDDLHAFRRAAVAWP